MPLSLVLIGATVDPGDDSVYGAIHTVVGSFLVNLCLWHQILSRICLSIPWPATMAEHDLRMGALAAPNAFPTL